MDQLRQGVMEENPEAAQAAHTQTAPSRPVGYDFESNMRNQIRDMRLTVHELRGGIEGLVRNRRRHLAGGSTGFPAISATDDQPGLAAVVLLSRKLADLLARNVVSETSARVPINTELVVILHRAIMGLIASPSRSSSVQTFEGRPASDELRPESSMMERLYSRLTEEIDGNSRMREEPQPGPSRLSEPPIEDRNSAQPRARDALNQAKAHGMRTFWQVLYLY